MLRRESPPYPPCPRALASKPLLKKGALRQAGNKVKRGGLGGGLVLAGGRPAVCRGGPSLIPRLSSAPKQAALRRGGMLLRRCLGGVSPPESS